MKKKYNIPVVSAEIYDSSPDRYELQPGLQDDAPLCEYGHPFLWIGYDLTEKQYVRFTKSVFKRLVNKIDPDRVKEITEAWEIAKEEDY